MARERGHAEVSYTDLLITLDYLLNRTDEKHPANTLEICRYARDEYGLTYKEHANDSIGNQVKHTRFSQCIDFLFKINNKHPGALPFILKRKNGNKGKAYIENKFYFDNNQISKLLEVVKNNKFISNKEADGIIDNIIFLLGNAYNREELEKELSKSSKEVNKPNRLNLNKIQLVEEALKQERIIIVYQERTNNKISVKIPLYCRVYKIKEFNNKLNAILFPLNKSFIICDAVENLDIRLEDPLIEDDKRDLEKEFFERNSYASYFYKDFNDLFEKNIKPISIVSSRISFYFDIQHLSTITNSFLDFFGIQPTVVLCNKFSILNEKGLSLKSNKFFIDPIDLKTDEKATYGVVNLIINKNSFVSWLVSNPFSNDKVSISDLVTVVGPESVNIDLSNYYKEKYLKYKKYQIENLYT